MGDVAMGVGDDSFAALWVVSRGKNNSLSLNPTVIEQSFNQ